jgi:hypothetical protein
LRLPVPTRDRANVGGCDSTRVGGRLGQSTMATVRSECPLSGDPNRLSHR